MRGAADMKEKQHEELLSALKARFEKNMNRHEGLEWAAVRARLEASPGKLWSLNEMERTGGEPDVVAHDKKTGEYVFYDCSAESPKGRRSLCYDREALESRKEFKPEDSAMDMATAMGIEILTEEQYCDQCPISHVISACAVTSSVHDSHVISARRATSSVHAQSRDQCMIATCSLRSHSHDHRLSVTAQCISSHVISA